MRKYPEVKDDQMRKLDDQMRKYHEVKDSKCKYIAYKSTTTSHE